MIVFTASITSCDTVDDFEDTAQIEEITEKPTEPHLHVFGEWETVVNATCTAEGKARRVCGECGDAEEKKISPLPHTLTQTVIAPDCKNEGYTLLKCECGYKQKTDVTERLDHSIKNTVVPPSCTENGYTTHLCTLCGHSYNDTYVEKLGHEFTSVSVRPTVLARGSTTHICHCSFSYTEYISYSEILPNAYVDQSTVFANGIDVSRWNHKLDANNNYIPLDWATIRASGVDFVILKAGSTKSGIEPTFEMDYEGARAAGLEIGVYFYTYSTTLDGIKTDVENLISWLEGKKFEYPIYLDLEDPSLEALSQDLLSDMCAAFMSALQAKGYYAGLYSNFNWLTYILDTEEMMSKYEIWYARYPGTSSPVWDKEKYGDQLGMWQYSDSGTIDGFDCAFDLNFAYKNYREIMEKWELNGFVKNESV